MTSHNKPQALLQCLAALKASTCPEFTIIIVDDTSMDDIASVARIGIHLLRLATNLGPAARNCGARHARGNILFCVDADVVTPEAVSRVAEGFAAHPDLAAVFGSYDARPRAAGVVSYGQIIQVCSFSKGYALLYVLAKLRIE